MQRVGRSTFRKLYWGPLLCLVLLFVLSTNLSAARRGTQPAEASAHPILAILACAICVWFFLGRPVAYLLVPVFVSTLLCPGCGEEIDAVAVWDCKCGFRDFRERHILAGNCLWCGKVAGRTNCPRCNCTILLW